MASALLRGVGVVETGHEGEVAVVGGVHELAQVVEAVDRFAQWSELEDALAVALFHVAVVLEEGDIVGGALDARDDAGLVVELEAGGTHVMADAGALDAGGEVVADLALVVGVEFVPEEGGDMLGFDDMHGGAHDRLVQGLEGRLLAEHDVGGVLDLHEAPVHAVAEVARDRAEAPCPLIEVAMQGGIEAVGKTLGLGGIGDAQEGVVGGLEADAGLRQLPRQPAVAVEVDLQAKRRPGRHPHVAQAELRVDEVEVVVQALAADRLEEGLAARLVVPGAIGGTGLHGREDVHQTGMIAALGEDLLDPILLAERLELADELDLQPGLGGQALGVGADLIAQRLGPAGIVEQADVARSEVARHRLGVADVRQGAGDHHPVEARQHAADLVLVLLDKGIHRLAPVLGRLPRTIVDRPCLVPASPG